MGKAPALAGAFPFCVCIDYRGLAVKNRHGFLVCFLGVRWVGGLTWGFIGDFGWENKQQQRQYWSLRPSGFTPAFGRAEAAARLVYFVGLKPHA